ncbi:hypothetical protein [Natronospora cellulosivora (SeqCode)]
MKKYILIMVFMLIITGGVNAEWRSGLMIGNNEGFGIKVIEYIAGDNLSFYFDSRVIYNKEQTHNSTGRLGIKYYTDKNNGFFGDVSYIIKDDNAEEIDKTGFGIGGGYIHQISNSSFVSLDAGYALVEGSSNLYFGTSLDFSWSNLNRERKKRNQKYVEKFLDRHPNISEEAKEYVKEKTPKTRMEYIDQNPELSGEIKSKFIKGYIWIGMTDEMARIVLGQPNDINRTVTAFRVREQWVYGDVSNRKYYYFENGILTSWQN